MKIYAVSSRSPEGDVCEFHVAGSSMADLSAALEELVPDQGIEHYTLVEVREVSIAWHEPYGWDRALPPRGWKEVKR